MTVPTPVTSFLLPKDMAGVPKTKWRDTKRVIFPPYLLDASTNLALNNNCPGIKVDLMQYIFAVWT